MEFKHKSVLLQECLEALQIKENGIYVDATLGGAGHSLEIIKHLTTGKLIGIDQDIEALKAAKSTLEGFLDKAILIHDNYVNIKSILSNQNIEKVDGILLDIGVSSYQLDNIERGFSHNNDAFLDMRMNKASALTAWTIVNEYSEKELHRIIKYYGEENWAKRIAQFIVKERANSPINTTLELVSIIKAAIPKKARIDGPHPAKRTFQAIRIEVNKELEVLKTAIADMVEVLNPKGRLAIITFHSLEDRIVKEEFKELYKDCICPKEIPICNCDKQREIEIITRKPILPSELELEQNPRSRSAKLRVAEKL